MNIWSILGIEPTDDKKIIKTAYAKKLRLCNPEDDEKAFIELRSAYEKAIDEAEGKVEKLEEKDISIVDEFMKECGVLYSDFQKRIKLENWKKLFEGELYNKIYNDISKSEEMNVKMLLFLGKYRNIPTEIWEFLNSIFLWLEREDLGNYFTSDYLNHIFTRIISKWDLGYEAFVYKNVDYDKFISHRYNAQIYYSRGDFENTKKEIDMAKGIFDKDPYLTRIEGQYFISLNEINKAIEIFTKLIELIPDEIDGYLKRGFLYKRQGEMELAYKDYKKVLEIDDENIEVKGAVGEYYISIREYDKAKEIFEELLEESPNKINWRIYLGEIEWRKLRDIEEDIEKNSTTENKIKLVNFYYDKEEYSLCEEKIYEILDSGEIDKELYKILGYIRKNNEEYRKAIKCFDKYLDMQDGGVEENYEIIKEMAICYSSIEAYKLAIQTFEYLIAVNPEDDFALVEIGDSYRYLEKYDKGIEYCDLALKVNKDNWVANSTKGLCYYNMCEYRKALDEHNIVIENDKTFGRAWFRKGYCHMQLDEYDESLEAFEKAGENDQDESYFYIAYLNFKKRNLEIAKEYIEKYVVEYDENSIGYVLSGDIHSIKRSYHRAVDFYSKAIELETDYPECSKQIGYIYLELKDYKNSIYNLIKFVNNDCEDINIVLDAIWIAIQCEEFNIARQCIRKYESLVDDEPEKKTREYNIYKGMVLYALDYNRKAALEFEEAIKKKPTADAFLYLAMIFLEEGKKEEAEKLCRKAVELEPNNTIYQEKLELINEVEIQKGFLGIFKKKSSIEKLEVDKALRHTMHKPESVVFCLNI